MPILTHLVPVLGAAGFTASVVQYYRTLPEGEKASVTGYLTWVKNGAVNMFAGNTFVDESGETKTRRGPSQGGSWAAVSALIVAAAGTYGVAKLVDHAATPAP